MNVKGEQVTTVEKEMGITHKDFYENLPALLGDIPYCQSEDTITFQLNGKAIKIKLGPEKLRRLGLSVQLPVTPVTLCFHDFTPEEINAFISRFNLKFMRGGG